MLENRRRMDSVIEEKLNQILEYNKRQDERISEIHQIVTGNGTPENGLIVKTTRLSEKLVAIGATLKTHWIMIWAIFGAIIAIGLHSIFT